MSKSAEMYQGIQKTLSLLGDKWSCLIIFAIHEGCVRYTDLDNRIEGICPRTLSQKIDFLESQGLVEKNTYQPNRYHYVLTPKGESTIPILKSMADWGQKN